MSSRVRAAFANIAAVFVLLGIVATIIAPRSEAVFWMFVLIGTLYVVLSLWQRTLTAPGFGPMILGTTAVAAIWYFWAYWILPNLSFLPFAPPRITEDRFYTAYTWTVNAALAFLLCVEAVPALLAGLGIVLLWTLEFTVRRIAEHPKGRPAGEARIDSSRSST